MPEKKPQRFTRRDIVILSAILIIAFILRLYKIDTPLADWHSWRQADTAAVARNFVQDGFDLLHPRYDDVSNVQTGEYNPQGLRLVEFPLYNGIFALLYRYFPIIPLEQYGRLTTAVFSLVTIAIINYLLRVEASRIAAIAGAGIYGIFPFFVYFSRVVLPETTAVAGVFLAIFFLYLWQKQKGYLARMALYVLSIFFASASLLVKPTVGFYFIALIYIFFTSYRFHIFKRPAPYIYFVISVLPFLLWRYWITLSPVGEPAFEWLFTLVNTAGGQQSIFMRPAFFRWIFYERILLLIMGGWAGMFLVLGGIRKNITYIFGAIGIAALLFLLVFQGGNVQHDYYQTIILPAVAIYGGLGVSLLYEIKDQTIHKVPLTLVIVAVIALSLTVSFLRIKDNYHYSEQLVNTAHVIKTITPEDALVVTDTTGDTTLLYLAHRKGMPAVTAPLPELRDEHGMDYFVTNNEIAKRVEEDPKAGFEIVFKNDDVTIFKL